VLVDTCIWALAFRHKVLQAPEQLLVRQLQALILEGDACMMGVIRQEILSGIKHPAQYERLKERLQAFEDVKLVQQDYEVAASMFNYCRSQGVQGSHIDFLICAVASRSALPIFTIDGDFKHYALHLPIQIVFRLR